MEFFRMRGRSKNNFWTATELNLARELRGQGKQYKEIALQLPGRTEKALRRIFATNGWTKCGSKPIHAPRGGAGPVKRAPEVDERLDDERNMRAEERAQQDITARYFNDPPPSQSALAASPRGRGLVESRESLPD